MKNIISFFIVCFFIVSCHNDIKPKVTSKPLLTSYQLSIYTVHDIYHVDLGQSFRVFSETGKVDSIFTDSNELFEYIELLTASDALDAIDYYDCCQSGE